MYKKTFLTIVFTILMLCQPAVAQTPPPLIDSRTISILMAFDEVTKSLDTKSIPNRVNRYPNVFLEKYVYVETKNSNKLRLSDVRNLKIVVENLNLMSPLAKKEVVELLGGVNLDNILKATEELLLPTYEGMSFKTIARYAREEVYSDRYANAFWTTHLFGGIVDNHALINDIAITQGLSDKVQETVCYDSASMVMLCP